MIGSKHDKKSEIVVWHIGKWTTWYLLFCVTVELIIVIIQIASGE